MDHFVWILVLMLFWSRDSSLWFGPMTNKVTVMKMGFASTPKGLPVVDPALSWDFGDDMFMSLFAFHAATGSHMTQLATEEGVSSLFTLHSSW